MLNRPDGPRPASLPAFQRPEIDGRFFVGVFPDDGSDHLFDQEAVAHELYPLLVDLFELTDLTDRRAGPLFGTKATNPADREATVAVIAHPAATGPTDGLAHGVCMRDRDEDDDFMLAHGRKMLTEIRGLGNSKRARDDPWVLVGWEA